MKEAAKEPGVSPRPGNDRRPFTPVRRATLPAEAYTQEGATFFITTRALPNTRPFETAERCQVVLDVLLEQRKALGHWVGPYCLMPDHLHFVAGPGTSGISVWELMRRLHGASTNALWQTGWKGKVWQPKGFDVQVHGSQALEEVATYILHNPVRAGLVQEAEDWPWSGCLDPWDDLPNYGSQDACCDPILKPLTENRTHAHRGHAQRSNEG